jgi:ribosomal protein S8
MILFFDFIVRFNNSRKKEITVRRNKLVLSILKKLETNSIIKLSDSSSYKTISFDRLINVRLVKNRKIYTQSYVELQKIIYRKLDKGSKTDLLFSTSEGLLYSKELMERKIGGIYLCLVMDSEKKYN